MGLTKTRFPQTYRVDMDVLFSKGMDTSGDAEWRGIIEVIPTTSNSKNEVFYGDKGRVHRFRGERKPSIFREYKLNMNLDSWEMTETIPRDDMDDIPPEAVPGALKTKIGNFTNAVTSSLEAEAWEYLHNGTSQTGFDQNNLFSFNHTYTDSSGDTVSGITQGNMHLGGSQVAPSTIQILEEHFATLKTDTEKPWKGRLTDVVVTRGSRNAKAAKELNNSMFTVEIATALGANTDNVFKGSFNIIEVDYGIGASEWYGLDLSDPSKKPLKVLSHVGNGIDQPEFGSQVDGSHDDFWRRDWAYGIFMRFDFNPGYWQTAYLHGSSSYVFEITDSERQRIVQPNS